MRFHSLHSIQSQNSLIDQKQGRIMLLHEIRGPIRVEGVIVLIVLSDLLASADVPEGVGGEVSVVFGLGVEDLAVGLEGVVHVLRAIPEGEEEVGVLEIDARVEDEVQLVEVVLRLQLFLRVDHVLPDIHPLDRQRVLAVVHPICRPLRDVLHCEQTLTVDWALPHLHWVGVWHQSIQLQDFQLSFRQNVKPHNCFWDKIYRKLLSVWLIHYWALD